MINFRTIGMMYQLEILRQKTKFSENEFTALMNHAEKIAEIKQTQNPAKALKTIREYRTYETNLLGLFGEYNGDVSMMNDNIRKYESDNAPVMTQFKKVLNSIKR